MSAHILSRAGVAALVLAAVVGGGTPGGGAPAGAADARAAALTPEQRADSTLAAMTLDEKLSLMHGGGSCQYAGCTPAIPRLGIPALKLQDGPAGAGDGFTGVTQLPAPVAAAASFDPAAAQAYGQVLGSEQWGKGTNVVLAPTVNIVRDPRWGRAFESFGEDPYLAGRVGASDILGIQSQGPLAQVKHYAVYNQETNRNSAADNAVIAERTEREIYLPAFEAAVRDGHAASAMCSYSAINGPFACENPIQNTVLKGALGFDGFITSDWGATHSTVASANNGLDMEMPGSTYYGAALKTAVQNGQVSQSVIDQSVRRILVQMYRYGLPDKTQPGTPSSVVTTSAHAATAKQVAQEGAVLLKNANVLPVGAAVKKIAVIGPGAGPDAMSQGGGSAAVNAPYLVTPVQGLTTRAGSTATVTYAQGAPSSTGQLQAIPASGFTGPLTGSFYNNTTLSGTPVATRSDSTLDFMWGGASPAGRVGTTNWSAKWTGTLKAPTTGTYTFSITSDDGSRLIIGGQTVINNWYDQGSTTRTGTYALTAGQTVPVEVDYYQAGGASNLTLGWQPAGQSLHDTAVSTARASDLAVVVVNNFESEGSDLGSISLSGTQNQLVSDVAAANPNTVVVVNSGSAVLMPWATSVKGIVEAWYPGQEYGNALAGLLWGDVNFSGRLPVTFPAALADVPASTTAQWPGTGGTVQYSEGVKVGYRWYDSSGKTPAYPFGFGLSYTSFQYANLGVTGPAGDGSVTVAFDVTNTGTRAGAEVPQVYVGQPSATGEPPKQLRGFTRIALAPGATQRVSLTLDARSFQYWGSGGWTNATGVNQLYVGASSRDVRLTGQVTVGGSTTCTNASQGKPATASSTENAGLPASAAVDGNTGTRWSSQFSDPQWIRVDLGAARTLCQVVLNWEAAYGKAYQIQLSNDGTTWSTAYSTGTGTGGIQTVPVTGSARYVRVYGTQRGTQYGYSLWELQVLARP